MPKGRPKKLKGDETMPIFKKKVEQQEEGYQPIQPRQQVVEPVSRYQVQEIVTQTGAALIDTVNEEVIEDLTYKKLVLEKLDRIEKFIMG